MGRVEQLTTRKLQRTTKGQTVKINAEQFSLFAAPLPQPEPMTQAIGSAQSPNHSHASAPKLAEKAVLMRFSAGVGFSEERKNPNVTADVKKSKGLSHDSGAWDARLYPKEALKNVKSKISEAGAYHRAVTLPFDEGTGILPAALIKEYGDRMRQLKGEAENLFESEFLTNPERWIGWARQAHNGTFEPSFYPGCQRNEKGEIEFDAAKFIEEMREKFHFGCTPIPVPDAAHFTGTVSSLLGVDLQAVNDRVEDATKEAVKELFRRMVEPVKHMVATLSKDSPRIFDTLTGNVKEIAKLVPALNLADDPQLNQFAGEMTALVTKFDADKLREDEVARVDAKKGAQAILDKLSAYKL